MKCSKCGRRLRNGKKPNVFWADNLYHEECFREVEKS